MITDIQIIIYILMFVGIVMNECTKSKIKKWHLLVP